MGSKEGHAGAGGRGAQPGSQGEHPSQPPGPSHSWVESPETGWLGEDKDSHPVWKRCQPAIGGPVRESPASLRSEGAPADRHTEPGHMRCLLPDPAQAPTRPQAPAWHTPCLLLASPLPVSVWAAVCQDLSNLSRCILAGEMGAPFGCNRLPSARSQQVRVAVPGSVAASLHCLPA